MDILIQVIVNGLSNAAIYALIAFGYSLTFITTETLNFGQGEFVMMGAMLGIFMVTNWQSDSAALSSVSRPLWPLWAAYIVSVLIMAGAGVLLERYVMRPFSTGLSIGWIMSTVALSIILRNVFELLMGAERLPLKPIVNDSIKLEVGGSPVAIDWQKIISFVITVIVIIALQLFFTRTMLGKSIRAVAFNPTAAGLMGINVSFVKALAFAICGGLAALGGLILTPVIGGMGPDTGTSFGIAAFAVAIIGGLSSLTGIAIAALLYAITEQFIQFYVTIDLYRALTFLLLIVVLAVKPTGLFGKTLVQKV